MMLVIGITEVLLARIVSRPHVLLDLGEQLLLQRQVFQRRLDHVVGVAHRRGKVGRRLHALDRGLIVAEVLEVGEDAGLDGIEARRDRVVDRDVVAGEREYLGDAVPHRGRRR